MQAAIRTPLCLQPVTAYPMSRNNVLLSLLAIVLLFSVGCNRNDDDVQPANQDFVDPIGALSQGAVLINARTLSAPPVSVPGVPSIDVQLDLPIAVLRCG